MSDLKNTAKTSDITVSVGLLPALISALGIARNTHMMSGHKTAQNQIEALRKTIEAIVPEPVKAFDSGEWVDVFEAAMKGPLHIGGHNEHYGRDNTRNKSIIIIADDGRHWISNKHYPKDTVEENCKELCAILSDMTDIFKQGVTQSKEQAEEAKRSFSYASDYSKAFVTRLTCQTSPEGENWLCHVFSNKYQAFTPEEVALLEEASQATGLRYYDRKISYLT